MLSPSLSPAFTLRRKEVASLLGLTSSLLAVETADSSGNEGNTGVGGFDSMPGGLAPTFRSLGAGLK